MRVAYFSPMPPEASGIADYSALLLPALESARRRGRAPRRASGRRAAPTSRSTTSATTRTRTAGSSTRCAGGPGVVVLHEFVLHHLVSGLTLAPARRQGYLDAMEREGGVVGAAARPRRARQADPAALGEPRPRTSRSQARCSTSRPALIVHSHYVERGRARPATTGRLADPASGLAGVRTSRRTKSSGSPLFGCFGHLNATKRIPQLLAAFARLRRRQPDARLLLVGATSPRFDLDRGSSGSASARASSARTTSTRSGSGR